MDHKCSMCCVYACVHVACGCMHFLCVPCLSICFSFSYFKPFWFGGRGDCSQMLIRGGLQTAISLISFSGATWGTVWTEAEQCKHVWSYRPGDSFRKKERGSLFIVPPVKGRIQGCPSSAVQWRSEIVYQNKKWLSEPRPCSPLHNLFD